VAGLAHNYTMTMNDNYEDDIDTRMKHDIHGKRDGHA